MEKYLINYLKEHSDSDLSRKYTEYLKISLDWFIYDYGEHLGYKHLRNKKYSLKERVYHHLQDLSSIVLPVKTYDNKKNVLSSLRFSGIDLREDFKINPISSILQPIGLNQMIGDYKTFSIKSKLNSIISKGNFSDLYNKDIFNELESLKCHLLKTYKNFDFKALFLYTGQYFESKFLIDIFKELHEPSFIFSHGLPGIYSKDVDNNADYLMVWGEKIKENYIDAGFDPKKIYVVGNNKYKDIEVTKVLRNSLDDVLIIPSSSSLCHQHEWGKPKLIDRSMIVLYLYEVQNVLQRLGLKKARFRPHPSIRMEWVYGFLDKNFYRPDKLPLTESLRQSSLVIGATSTVFLESIMNGVNYIVYEPKENNETLLESPLVPPFDGSEKDLVIANNEEQLKNMIKDKYCIKPDFLMEYIQPLDLSILKQLV